MQPTAGMHPQESLREGQGCPAPSQGCAGLSSSLLAPLEMPPMTRCCSQHVGDYTCQHSRQKLSWHLMGREGSTGQYHTAPAELPPKPSPQSSSPCSFRGSQDSRLTDIPCSQTRWEFQVCVHACCTHFPRDPSSPSGLQPALLDFFPLCK